MHLRRLWVLILILFFILPVTLHAQVADESAVQDLKKQLEALKTEYQQKIQELEKQIEDLQVQMLQMPEPTSAPVAAPTSQVIPGILNPAISVIGNFLGRADNQEIFTEDGDRIDHKLNLREVEVDFRTAVDPYADAVMILTVESEVPGNFDAGVEEGYVTIKKLPVFDFSPLGLKLKIGRFRPAFGRSNILHTHDLPTSFYPLPVQEFLGEEGYAQNGISGRFFIPTPWDESSSLDATIDVLTGGDIALSPQKEARVSYLGHLRWFRTFSGGHDVELGWSSYFHPSGNDIGTASAHGVDFLYRWKPARQGQWKSFLVGGEFMFVPNSTVMLEEEVAPVASDTSSTPKGLSLFSQWQFNQRIYAGLKYDQAETLLNSNLLRQSITPYLSFYFSEFLRLRMSYEHRWSDLLEEDGRNSVFLEMNWIFGSHPPEPFWVNR